MGSNFKIETLKTKSGLTTIKVNDFLLHSKYDPNKEAEKIVQNNYKPGYTHILIGNGLGHISNVLASKLKEDEQLIIIEPLDLGESVVAPEKSIFLKDISQDSFEELIPKLIPSYKKVHIFCSPNYDKLFPDYIKSIVSVLKQRLQLNKVNEDTIRLFSEEWQKNYIFNLKHTVRDRTIEVLKGAYEKPVIIASGGPSLIKQLPILKKVRDYVLLIAAGSTINSLLKHGIIPDYVISIDGGEANYNHFKGEDFNSTKLIYSLFHHYRIRNTFNNQAYYFLPLGGESVKRHIQSITGEETPILIGGGSVATYALSLATYISNSPVAIIGQDLAYTDNKTHAESNKNYFVIDDGYRKRREMFFTKGYYGDEVLTDNVFYSMKETFEKMIKVLDPNIKIFNCTEGGVLLNGFDQLPFEEFCSEYVIEGQQLKELNLIPEKEISNEKKILLIDMLEKELDIYTQIKKTIDDSLITLKRNKSNSSFSNKILKKLDQNDVKLKSLINTVAMSRILEPLTIDTLKEFTPNHPNETIQEKYTRVYNHNKIFLERILEASIKSENYTLELIAELSGEEVVRND